MKSFKSFFFAVFILAATEAIAVEWVPVDDTKWHFDKSRIRIDKKGIVSVWLKTTLTDEAIKYFLNEYPRNLNIPDYSKYSYSVQLWDMDCKHETYGSRAGTDYTLDGSVINSYEVDNVKMKVVTPDSTGEAAFMAVCSYTTRTNNKKK